MNNFVFRAPKKIISKLGSSKNVGREFRELGCKRVLLVTDETVDKLGLLDNIRRGLQEENIKWDVFDQVQEDPSCSLVQKALRNKTRVDGVVGVGGGSSLDVAKILAYLYNNPNDQIDDLFGVEQCYGNSLPLI